MKIYLATAQALMKKGTQDETKFPTKILVGKLVWVPVTSFCKIIIPSYMFDALLYQNRPFSSPNRLTLWITLVCKMDQSEEVMNLCSTHSHKH